MDAVDWRTQLLPDAREKIVNKMMETMNKKLPMSGPEGVNELRRIAVKFEEDVFSKAISQTDYLRQISMKMLTMETKSQNPAGSLTSVPAANFTRPLETGHTMDDNNRRPSLSKEVLDWKTQLPPDSRTKIVNKILETLKKHLPFSGPEGINELRRIAARFEGKIFEGANNQTDYLRHISMKILTMETRSQNSAGSSPSIIADKNSLPLNRGLPLDNVEVKPCIPKEEPVLNTDDWRTQLPPDSRQSNAKEIMETLKKHVPNSDEEGIKELMKIAVSFEDLIFKTAINQVDYFRKISFKMQIMSMEESELSRPQKRIKTESH